MRANWTRYAAIAGLVVGLAVPAAAQQTSDAPATQADEKAREATTSTGEKITDAWILTKVKTQFVGEDALEDSDINVDVREKVVILKGTVASAVGKARAEQIAKTTEGVVRVDNRLTIGMARADDDVDVDADADDAAAGAAAGAAATAREAGREAKEESREAGREMKDATADVKDEAKEETAEARREGREAAAEAKEESREARRETGEAVGTAGQAVNDGWITTKVKGSFVGVDALEGSEIDVDTKNHVVTLKGTVPTTAARARAEEIARKIEGVTSVKNELKVAPPQQQQ